ncbi:MAG: 23S rRNA (adenine(2503)-C(2))-methyltransferase RlmN [Mycoplasmoidaceae bacterium]|nr:MAG: 23S rRNA (adenine(2503)-C(2))-methyltransferase RlmN [Mycoplasmoidaceae bacterium]
MNNIYGYTLIQLESEAVKNGFKKFNATQIFQWLYQKNVANFDQMKNIGVESRKKLNELFCFQHFELVDTLQDDKQDTIKFLFKLFDGQKIETVIMKFNYGYSVCVSTQVGCNMGCKFCASGLLKKIRDLETWEIVYQVVYVNNFLLKKNERISNIVVMGIGEPFDNYENLKDMLQIVTNHNGLGIGSRHITVSTCGIIPKILMFAKDFPQINLAISLHASNDKLRSSLMPINNAYSLKELIKVLKEYEVITKRKITFEYILLKTINDSKENAYELVNLLKGINCYVNLISYNKISEHSFEKSDKQDEFAKILISHKIQAITRLERGVKINAACGQLRAKYEK